MSNPAYCPRAFHGLTIRNITRENFQYSVCCEYTEWTQKSKTIDFDHPLLTNLREINLKGELPATQCRKCLLSEKSGSQSMRQGYMLMHGPETYDKSIRYLDINVDYTCNLACVTCGPELSTTWRKELGIKGPSPRPILDEFLENLDNLDLSQLHEVAIWGGEPFVTHTHLRVLEYLINRGLAPQVRLMYNTNGTRIIDDYTKSLLEQFKFVRISFSIDGIGDRFDYLRYPAKWEDVEKNLLWWRDNLPHNTMLAMTVTVSLLNVFYINEIFQWHADNFSESCYGDPIEIYPHYANGIYGIEQLPENAADALKNIEDYPLPWVQKFPNLGTKSHRLPEVLESIRIIDHRRNLDLNSCFPELAELIRYCK